MTSRFYTIEDIQHRIIRQVARKVGSRYRNYTTIDDIHQELYCFFLENHNRFERWLANDPQQTTRVWRSLEGAAKRFAATEKARSAGYEESDVYYYSAGVVEELLDAARNPEWSGETPVNDGGGRGKARLSETGTLMAMVMDVRRALKSLGSSTSVDAIVSYLNNSER